MIECRGGCIVQRCSHSEDIIAEVFYNINYVNINYSVKNGTVDCKYFLFLQDFFLFFDSIIDVYMIDVVENLSYRGIIGKYHSVA